VWLTVWLGAGCSFRVAAVDESLGPDLAATPDGPVDVRDFAGLDLTGFDLALVDLAHIDLAQVDLATMDLSTVFVPSHVPASTYKPGAIDLAGLRAVDTDALQIDLGAGLVQPPPGVVFAAFGGIAVLSVGGLSIDFDVSVTGSRPLAIVAARAVVVDHAVNASADLASAGPGGMIVAIAQGLGGNGANSGFSDGGGGGGGYSTIGGAGGGAGGTSTTPAAAGGPAGASYTVTNVNFFGGSPGGNGSSACNTGLTSVGGAGGGALQISSAVSIEIKANGRLSVNGGGGTGGCKGNGASGGGGGSAGVVFLEAPTVSVAGKLTANGGGGGSGSIFPNTDGSNGDNGHLDGTQGTGGQTGGGHGGNGGSSAGPATAGAYATNNGGGGGGAAGFIWLRTRGTQAATTGIVSPSASFDTSL